MKYLEMESIFKTGSTLKLKNQMFDEVSEHGFQPTERFNKNHNASFVAGRLLGLSLKGNENNYSIINHLSENNRKPMEWNRFITNSKIIYYISKLDDNYKEKFAVLCSEDLDDNIDEVAFLAGLFSS